MDAGSPDWSTLLPGGNYDASLFGWISPGAGTSQIPQLFTTYLPASLGPLPTLLFGAGAVLLARNPDGIITMNGRQISSLARRLTGDRRPLGGGRSPGGGQPALAGPVSGRVPAPVVSANMEDSQ